MAALPVLKYFSAKGFKSKIKTNLKGGEMYILKRISVLILTAVFIFGTVNISKAQFIGAEKSNNTVDYQSVAAFKTFARKKEFRVGDFIVLNVAMLNKSEQPVNFLNLDFTTSITVYNSNGNQIKSYFFYRGRRALEYTVLPPKNFYFDYFIFSLGCESFYDLSGITEEEQFNKNYFGLKGNGCIDIKKPGEYSISFGISNKIVEINKTEKTAVGTMESTPFEITIVEDSKK